ncbi:MAG: GNAT family N-acetyltransferase [Emergencia sp.]
MDREKTEKNCSSVRIRRAEEADLDRIAEIEHECFPPQEAASREKYAWRLAHYPELFLVGEDDNGHICGCICMISMDAALITDEVFETEPIPGGRVCAVLTVMTENAWRGQGIAGRLLTAGIETARSLGMESIVLTCKEHLIHFYARFGFEKQGVSASVHGGATWYDMARKL